MDEAHTQISQENLGNRENKLFSIDPHEKYLISMISKGFLGNLDVNLIHPPPQVLCTPSTGGTLRLLSRARERSRTESGTLTKMWAQVQILTEPVSKLQTNPEHVMGYLGLHPSTGCSASVTGTRCRATLERSDLGMRYQVRRNDCGRHGLMQQA